MADKDDIDDETEREDEESGSEESADAESERAEESDAEVEERSTDDAAEEEDEEDVAEEDDAAAATRQSTAEKRARDEARDLAREAKALLGGQTSVPTQLGSARYVHAAFFASGILVAYISSKILGQVWASLADWPAATRKIPILLRFAEDERGSYVLAAGAVIGVITVIQTYRNEKIRRYADEVAAELSKVTWPDREMVTNGTIVCIVASIIATVYVALLDWLWKLLSTSVYGA
jgi:preprotein translocase subunit SecE